MPQRDESRPGHHVGQARGQAQPVGQQPRQHHPGLGDRPGPTDLDLESLRPCQRGIADPPPGACSLHLKGAPS